MILPAILAAAHVEHVPDAAHDLGVVRAVGLGWTGAFRALDVLACALFAWLPLGTRAFRAGLAAAAAAGIGAGLVFGLARRLVATCAPEAGRIGPAAAAIAAVTAGSTVAWQLEAAAPGGSVLGAVLAIAPLAIAARAERVQDTHFVHLGVAVGLALGYEPLVGLAAAVSALAYLALVAPPVGGSEAARGEGIGLRAAARTALPASAGLVGLALPALAWIRGRTDPRMILPRAPWIAPLGEASASGRTSPLRLVYAELGWGLAGLAVAGLALALVKPRARPLAAGLVAIALVGYAGVLAGAPAGPTRWAGTTLAALGATLALGAVATQALVRAVANARIPFARASAAMIVLLLCAFPARVADDAWTRAEIRARGGSSAWDEAAWGGVPPGAILLTADARALERIVASRATGAMRADLAVVPISDLAGRMASYEIAREPNLRPFLRDMSLEGAPEELSLSTLAAARPLVMTFDPRWDKPLARHLVPAGMVARFETEPRGSSDRRRAAELSRAARERLARLSTDPRDLDLCDATASLLRSRAIAYAAAGDRDLVAYGLDDLRPFAPDDRVASELSRRVVTSKGGIEVKDLGP